MFWGFAYNPNTGAVSLGPWEKLMLTPPTARPPNWLTRSIWPPGKSTYEARRPYARVVAALDRAGLHRDSPEGVITVSSGHDLQIWLSLRVSGDAELVADEQAARKILAALATDGLQLVSPTDPDDDRDLRDRLARGEPLYVRERSL